MRTTVDIDDDVLLAAREIAQQRRVSMGKVLSDLSRQALMKGAVAGSRHGVPLFPAGDEGGIVTIELINRLRDEAP